MVPARIVATLIKENALCAKEPEKDKAEKGLMFGLFKY